MRRKFEWRMDEDYGYAGWTPRWLEGANAGEGRVVAHDALEHSLREPGEIEGELMAMGSMWWLRGQTGRLGGMIYSAEQSVALEFATILRDSLHKGLRAAPATRRLDEETEDQLDEMLCQLDLNYLKHEVEDHDDLAALGDYRGKVANWFRRGYRRAHATYKAGPHAMIRAFDHIVYEADRMGKQAEEGDTITVQLDPLTAAVQVRYQELHFSLR